MTEESQEKEYGLVPPPMYSNVTYRKDKCLPIKRPVKDWQEMPNRMVVASHPDRQVTSNQIETAKYNLITFLPLNLIEQFSKFANIYFLLLGLLQIIPSVSASDGIPTLYVPLFFIVFITGIKDFCEDLSRKQSDKQENYNKCNVLKAGGVIESRWEALRIGDIIRIKNNEFFPADVVLLQSSDPLGLAYVETKNLDGETNLKHKKVIQQCQDNLSVKSASQVFSTLITLCYEKPNPFIYLFKGSVSVGDQQKKIGIDQQQLALRGCSLRNTEFVYGVVVYTGDDTKIMLNSMKARAKVSNVMRQMNNYILVVLVLQILFCISAALFSVIGTSIQTNSTPYLYLDKNQSFFIDFLTRFGNWNLLFGNFVPISLLVTLEMVKYIQGIIISKDSHFFSDKFQIGTQVQSSSLNEELGQIQYIFSDKTGTLTQNIMDFKLIDVLGKVYGQQSNGKGQVDSKDIEIEIEIESEMKEYPKVDKVDFNSGVFMNMLEKQDMSDPLYVQAREYLFHLGLCHTILVTYLEGERVYNASSPDEYALVQMARYCGFEYDGLDSDNNMTLIDHRQSKSYSYELLDVLEFSSARKRMSVILRDRQTQQITLYCKGADNIIESRLDQASKRQFGATNSNLQSFASVGLRTLLLGKRILSQEQYCSYREEMDRAQTESSDKESAIGLVQEQIEVDLEMVGGTAIEDKLQEEVGPTLAYIKRAGIKVWVLTGDKVETAINIGYSTCLLDDELLQFITEDKDKESVMQTMVALEKQIKTGEELNNVDIKIPYALVISGECLLMVQGDQMRAQLFRLAECCKVVIACRVSPKQKAEIVNLVKEYKKDAITLAIGDGANDVNMITAAHVGVGIMGVEGNQAARASDYSMGEFKFLRRLLLVKGREFYRRNSILICYNFWKNFILVIPSFLYGFFNLFSGQQLYDSMLLELYNVIYCNLPIIYFALHDKEYPEKQLLNNPHYYFEGLQGKAFNRQTFYYWALNGIFYSNFILFGLLMAIAHPYQENGLVQFSQLTGYQLLLIVVFLANSKIMTFSTSFTVTQSLINSLSTVSFLVILYLTSTMPFMNTYSEFKNNLFPFIFWVTVICLTSFCLIIDWSFSRYRYVRRQQQFAEEKIQENIQNEKNIEIKKNNNKLFDEVLQEQIQDGQVIKKQGIWKNALEKILKQKNAIKAILKNSKFTHKKRHTGFAFSIDETKKK